MTFKFLFITFLLTIFSLVSSSALAEVYYNRTIGASAYGSIPLVDTLPEVEIGVGGGLFFDYRFNDRFSLMSESFVIFQDGHDRSTGEGNIIFYGAAVTFKIYLLRESSFFDPYAGLGIGFYGLTEGSLSNNTGGVGLGAQVEVGFQLNLSERFIFVAGGTYRSVGIINSLSGDANATTYMPYTLFGRIGYRF